MKSTTTTVKEDQILLALLEHPTQERAAALGISTTTVWRCLKKPEFRRRYNAARREAFSLGLRRMLHAAPAAVAALGRIMRNKEAPAAARLRAAKCVLKFNPAGFAPEDLLARIDDLKDLTDVSRGSPRPAKSASVGQSGDFPGKTRASDKTERLIVALFECGSHEKAAAALGISPMTVWRLSRKPEFQEQSRKAGREYFSSAMVRLQQTVNTAVSTVLAIMVDADAPAAIQVEAANCVLECCGECMREDVQAEIEPMEQTPQERAA